MNTPLSGKVALVTGASKGLGANIARTLVNSGAKVAINYMKDSVKAESLQSRISESGGIAECFQADVTDQTEIRQMVKNIEVSLGTIDILVINATGPQPDLSLEDIQWSDILSQLEYFAKSPLHLVQSVLPAMKESGYGRIINIGSEVFQLGAASCSHYVAAKGAQLGLTRSWARELGPYGITVNFVAPGWISGLETESHKFERRLQEYLTKVPLAHQGSAVDVAETVLFLASESARFITGQSIAVNGGNTFN